MLKCLCCGIRTRSAGAIGDKEASEACSVCGWVDIPLDTREAQDLLVEVKAAYEGQRSVAAEAVRVAVRSAFADVSPGGRVDLRRAVRRDYYGEDVALPVADWADDDQHWWDIPDRVLDLFDQRSSVFSFGNAASFRYYLPAYLSLGLRTSPEVGVRALSLAHVIDDGEVLRDPLSLVTEDQRAAAVAFLNWVVEYEQQDSVRSDAMTALLRWDIND